MDSKFEYAGDKFRIGRKENRRWVWSDYVPVTSIAYLTIRPTTYMGVGQYFDGVIPTETVLRLQPTKTEVKLEAK